MLPSPSTRTTWRSRADCCCAPRASCRRARGSSRRSMTDRKRDSKPVGDTTIVSPPRVLAQERQIDPLADVLRKRTPPEARLGPYPVDDLVDTPAPRPSLAPFGSADVIDLGAASRKRRAAAPAACDYVELHARSAFSFLHAASLPEDLASAAAAAGHAVFGLADVGGL